MKYIGILILSVAFCLSISFQPANAQSNHSLYTANKKKVRSTIETHLKQLLRHSSAQQKKVQVTVSGTVTDAKTGKPLVGVNILVLGTTTGTITDVDGHYSLTVPSLQDTLRFSFIGYKTKKVPIDGRTTVNVALKSTVTGLNQLVVTGVGIATQKKKLGASVGIVTSKDLGNVTIASPTQMLSAHIPGLIASSSGGSVGGGATIRLRGSSSLSLRNSPVIYLDGVRIDSRTVSGGTGWQTSRLNDINPASIKSIQVLKGAAAGTLYGSQANAGVIQIFTKDGQPGPMQFHLSITQSIGRTPRTFPGSYAYIPSKNKIIHINPMGTVLDNSYGQSYSLSASGGSDQATYFATAFFNNATGVVPKTRLKRAGGRLNIKLMPSDMISARVGLAYTSTVHHMHPDYGSPGNLRSNAILANPRTVSQKRPYGFQFTPYNDILNIGINQKVGNLFSSLQLNIDWGAGVTSKFILGITWYIIITVESFLLEILFNRQGHGRFLIGNLARKQLI